MVLRMRWVTLSGLKKCPCKRSFGNSLPNIEYEREKKMTKAIESISNFSMASIPQSETVI